MFKKYYGVFDFYEKPFGEELLFTDDLNEAKEFIKEYTEECDDECYIKILTMEVRV